MIREMVPEDRGAYLALSKAFYASDAVTHTVSEEVFQRNFAEIMRANSTVRGYIFEAEGEIAGYALTSEMYSTEVGGKQLWLEEAFILPKWRSKGLGRQYFEMVKAMKGYKRLRLEVMPGNARAQALYKRQGFAPLEYAQMILDTP